MSTYYAILTAVGEAKLANATALGTKLQLSAMAVGDGNGALPNPVRTQTGLIRETYRADLNNLSVDPLNASQIIAELVIPETEGGYWLREMGIYDAAGDLFAIANCPPSYKPQMAEGSGRTQVLRMVLIVSSTAAVQLKIDPSVVLATRAYVDTAKAAAITAAAQLIVVHMEEEDPHPQYKLSAATKEEAENGTNASGFMTALRVFQAVRSAALTATELLQGALRLATQSEVEAGTNDYTAVTPKKLRAGSSFSRDIAGHVAFPRFLGGLIIQWGFGATDGTGSTTLTLPLVYPTAHLATLANIRASTGGIGIQTYDNFTASVKFRTFNTNSGASLGSTSFFWLSIGW